VEPEGEIVVVIGRTVRQASRDEAAAAVFGYTCGNDVSARDWQKSDAQWWRAKGADTFGAFGPAIVTGLAHDALTVRTRVNGQEVQHGRSADLIRDIPEVVRLVSAAVTLQPGDLIFTGTPGEPGRIVPGDVVEVEVTGAGTLRNPVGASDSL
jgi:2-keto-4-pentenoate hydratase/2-oxohepta-3-ene-1,7-dioic acid hydratase in catechol pathway